MPFLAPVFGALGSLVGSAGAALGITAKGLISLAINVGMSLLQGLMMRGKKPDDVQNVIRQSAPYRVVHLGRGKIGGAILFMETKGRTLYQVTYLGDMEVDGFEEIIVDGRPLQLDDKGYAISEPYKDKKPIRIETRDGASRGRVYSALLKAFKGIVTAEWRGDGLATILCVANSVGTKTVNEVYPNRIPVVQTIGRWGKVYDPRTGKRAWSELLPLLLLEYLTNPLGAGIDRDLIDLDDFARAARIANQVLDTKGGGSVRRYAGMLSWSTEEAPKDVIARACRAMDGRLYLKPSGKIGFDVGEWIEPTVHIDDWQIIEMDCQRGPSPMEEATEIVVSYTSPEAGYAEVTSDPWVSRTVKRGDTRVRNAALDIFEVQNHNHARRLAKIIDYKTNPNYRGSLTTTLAGLAAWDQRFIEISYEPLGLEREIVEVMGITYDRENLTVEIEFQSASPAMYRFNPATEEGIAPVNPASLGSDAVPTPSSFAVKIIVDRDGGDKDISARLSVEQPARNSDSDKKDDLDTEFQYSRANRNIWRRVGEIEEAITVEVNGLVEGVRYDFRARHRANGSPSDWVMIEDVPAVDDAKAPAKPTKRSLDRTSALVATAVVRAPKSANFAGIRLYRDIDNRLPGASLVETVYGAPGGVITLIDEASSGRVYHYWARAINFSGVESPAVYLGSVDLR